MRQRSVRKEVSQTPHGTGRCDHAGVAFREYVKARHGPAVLFQPAKQRSMMLRCRYMGQSNCLGKPSLGFRTEPRFRTKRDALDTVWSKLAKPWRCFFASLSKLSSFSLNIGCGSRGCVSPKTASAALTKAQIPWSTSLRCARAENPEQTIEHQPITERWPTPAMQKINPPPFLLGP